MTPEQVRSHVVFLRSLSNARIRRNVEGIAAHSPVFFVGLVAPTPAPDLNRWIAAWEPN